MNYKTTLLIVFFFAYLLFAQGHLSYGSIAINEFMASNATGITDEDGDNEDWIELYNFGDEVVGLEGWSLSDNYNEPFKWVFPDITVAPGEFLIVWASGKDRKEGELHTNFKISSQGEELILVDESGIWIDEITPIHVPTDISYGRFPDGTGSFFFFSYPTPGTYNMDNGFEELLVAPVFSHPPGFYTDSFYLKVHHPDQEATIRYTLDGSVPEPGSPVFPDSLLIYNRKHDPDQISAVPTTPTNSPEWFRWFPPMDVVFKGTNIRVKAFKEDAFSPFTETCTFWVDSQIQQRYSLPVISISMDQDDLLGSSGIYTNFTGTGMQWEREMHIAFFDPDGVQTFATDAGVRVHGGNSRRYALKSFRVYFRNAYGHSAMTYPLFGEYDQAGVHDRLILRNAGSDWAFTYYRDAFVQSLLHGFSDVETQAYQPAVVFLNSEYWGILNVRERYDNNYIENQYGYTDIDMLDNMGSVNYGSNLHYTNLIQFLHNNSLEDSENYEHVKRQMDVEDFRDYHILQIFAMNTDQPGKNVRFWRPRTPDGKWRWMWWDMDDSFHFGPHNPADRNGIVYCTGLNYMNSSTVNPATPPPSWAPNGPNQTFPLRALLRSPEFRADFINRFADLLNTAFRPNYLETVIDAFHDMIGPYLYEHYRRWHRPNPEVYQDHLNRLYVFSQNRREIMFDDMLRFFDLQNISQVTLDRQGAGHLRINSLELTSDIPSLVEPIYPWNGDYFAGIPIELEAIPAAGYQFSHWEGDIQAYQPVISFDPVNNTTVTAHFVPEEAPAEREVFAFWFFDDQLPNDTPFEFLDPVYALQEETRLHYQSALDGYPFFNGHDFWRKASLERRNQPTILNYQPTAMDDQPYDPDIMRGIQVRQPFFTEYAENTMIVDLPTTGYKDVIFSFAVMDEGAAQSLLIDYSLTGDEGEWLSNGLSQYVFPLSDEYINVRLDLADIEEIANNEDFSIRIRFDGTNMQADDGNRVTFNNFAAEGNRIADTSTSVVPLQAPLLVYPNPAENGKVFLSVKGDYSLFDITGKVIMNTKNTKSLDINGLARGIYIIKDQFGRTVKLSVIR